MSDSKQEYRYLEVTMMNGKVRKFAFETLGGDPSTSTTRVKELLNAKQLILQQAERLTIVPIANIQSIEVVPSPANKMPQSLSILQETYD
jgi:hypothetical protein